MQRSPGSPLPEFAGPTGSGNPLPSKKDHKTAAEFRRRLRAVFQAMTLSPRSRLDHLEQGRRQPGVNSVRRSTGAVSLKPAQPHSNRHSCTQTGTASLKPAQPHSNRHSFTQAGTGSGQPLLWSASGQGLADKVRTKDNKTVGQCASRSETSGRPIAKRHQDSEVPAGPGSFNDRHQPCSARGDPCRHTASAQKPGRGSGPLQ